MQTNSMKQALARGETQVGVWINMVRNPAILRLMKSAGLDFARFDMEHASPSMETLSNMALLARAMDFTLTVRPPQGNREWITRLLDAGVWSLHVPQVDTPEIAQEVVNASLYAPDGLRGMAGIGNHPDYETGPVGETQRFLNAQIHLAIMFESTTGVRQHRRHHERARDSCRDARPLRPGPGTRGVWHAGPGQGD